MAEILTILGAIAAGTQLFHYGCKGLAVTSALSHHTRHRSDQIQVWVHDSSTATQLIDAVERVLPNNPPVISGLVESCRKDAQALELLLGRFAPDSVATRSKTSELAFVLRKGPVIRGHFSSFEASFTRLAHARVLL